MVNPVLETEVEKAFVKIPSEWGKGFVCGYMSMVLQSIVQKEKAPRKRNPKTRKSKALPKNTPHGPEA